VPNDLKYIYYGTDISFATEE